MEIWFSLYRQIIFVLLFSLSLKMVVAEDKQLIKDSKEKLNLKQDSKFLPENQKLDRFLNLGGPSNQPLFRIITRSLKPPYRPSRDDFQERGFKLPARNANKHRFRQSHKAPPREEAQEYDDYEEPNLPYVQTTPQPYRETDYGGHQSSPRRSQPLNLNQDEIYYDEVYFDEDDSSYQQQPPKNKVGHPFHGRINNQGNEKSGQLFTIRRSSPPYPQAKKYFSPGHHRPRFGNHNQPKPYGPEFGDYEDDYEPAVRYPKPNGRYLKPGENHESTIESRQGSRRNGYGFFHKPRGFPTLQELSGGFSSKRDH